MFMKYSVNEINRQFPINIGKSTELLLGTALRARLQSPPGDHPCSLRHQSLLGTHPTPLVTRLLEGTLPANTHTIMPETLNWKTCSRVICAGQILVLSFFFCTLSKSSLSAVLKGPQCYTDAVVYLVFLSSQPPTLLSIGIRLKSSRGQGGRQLTMCSTTTKSQIKLLQVPSALRQKFSPSPFLDPQQVGFRPTYHTGLTKCAHV